jgi:adhesin/invasin
MRHRATLRPLSAALLLLALAVGCGKANPVAPSGSTLRLQVNPAAIPSPRGSATATATLIGPNGTPDNGAQVQFTTTLGTFNPPVAATKSDGNAASTLTGNGISGTAKVTAFSGDVMSTELDVTIGSSGSVKTIILQAVPANVPASGGTLQLVALVRDVNGQPTAGVLVDFTTTVGRLSRLTDTTNGGGLATSALVLQASDVTNQTSITVTANAAAADGSLVTGTATIGLLTNAAASIIVSASPGQIPASASNVTINLTALVLNAEGAAVPGANVSFSATLGTLSQTGIVPTSSGGVATDVLTVSSVPAGTTGITVTATVTGAGGTPVTGTTTITITGG